MKKTGGHNAIRPVKQANLPQNKVRTVIASCSRLCEKTLRDLNINVIGPSKEVNLEEAISLHADMSFLHLGGNEYITTENQEKIRSELADLGMKCKYLIPLINSPYPTDCKLNVSLIGKNAVFNPKTVSSEVHKYILESGFNPIYVKQGYTKCSISIINENSIITEDEGIHKACEKAGIESLLIAKGDIELEGHGYGFIGGSSGKVAKNKIAFTGEIERHSDAKRILDFLEAKNVEYICLEAGPLKDIGGILPIMEEDI